MKGILKKIKRAQVRIFEEIAANAAHGRYGAGLASEGYAGGYSAALSDVSLLLRGCPPCVRPEYWRDFND